jgi:hypothetical protein
VVEIRLAKVERVFTEQVNHDEMEYNIKVIGLEI